MPLDQIDVDKERSGGKEMTFLEHLEELRWHIIRGLLYVIGAAIVLFAVQGWVFDVVIFGPTHPEFISYQMFCQWSHALGLGDTMCIQPPQFTMQAVGVGEPFIMAIKMSIIGGFVVGFPFVFREFWRFIEPGMHDPEQRATRGAVFICSTLFLAGVLFGYFIIAPFGVRFLIGYSIPGVENIPTVSSLINYMIMFTLPSGFIFELPVVVYVLSRLGLATPAGMRRYRRHAIVGTLIVAGIFTPPDAVTQFLIGIPLFVLYEVSIFISARVERQLAKREREESLAG
ncbi:MAG TPA: twin-arginine translocase subunit TatC [Saprospiraceae bacterium]|nr:twin-arginine translocase subunit TatC [Saprospiraceae bacterium]HMP23448.1 twin-arginine translocase subunit TatC [Saprospiraceae bacterium]